MRVLFTTTPGRGHYLAMVPLAAACREMGHEVLWATAPDGCAGLRERGFDAVAAGLPEGATSGDLGSRLPGLMALPASQRSRHVFVPIFGPDRAGPMLEQLLPVVRDWGPSLLVCDRTEFAGPIAAAVAGVPNVTHSFGHPPTQALIDRVAEALAPLWRAHGLDSRPHAGIYDHLYLDIYPQSLQSSALPAGAAAQPVRPARVLPAVLEPGEPLVYLTYGTVFGRDLGVHRTVLDGIADLPIRVLVTLGPHTDAAALGVQPPNVQVAEFVPQAEILPRAAAVISHGGSGTFLAALAAGVPQVVLPSGADQFDNAAAGVAAGAAIRIDPEALSSGAVRDALVALLDDPSHAAAARRVREEIRAMPAHEDVVGDLERLAGTTITRPVGAPRAAASAM